MAEPDYDIEGLLKELFEALNAPDMADVIEQSLGVIFLNKEELEAMIETGDIKKCEGCGEFHPEESINILFRRPKGLMFDRDGIQEEMIISAASSLRAGVSENKNMLDDLNQFAHKLGNENRVGQIDTSVMMIVSGVIGLMAGSLIMTRKEADGRGEEVNVIEASKRVATGGLILSALILNDIAKSMSASPPPVGGKAWASTGKPKDNTPTDKKSTPPKSKAVH